MTSKEKEEITDMMSYSISHILIELSALPDISNGLCNTDDSPPIAYYFIKVYINLWS
jgi:hypothetical protein